MTSVSPSVCCPWCNENVVLRPDSLLPTHHPSYMEGRECHCSGLSVQHAQDRADESMMRHAATGE